MIVGYNSWAITYRFGTVPIFCIAQAFNCPLMLWQTKAYFPKPVNFLWATERPDWSAILQWFHSTKEHYYHFGECHAWSSDPPRSVFEPSRRTDQSMAQKLEHLIRFHVRHGLSHLFWWFWRSTTSSSGELTWLLRTGKQDGYPWREGSEKRSRVCILQRTTGHNITTSTVHVLLIGEL